VRWGREVTVLNLFSRILGQIFVIKKRRRRPPKPLVDSLGDPSIAD